MSKPDDTRPDAGKTRGRGLLVLTAVALVATGGALLQLPVGATGSIADRGTPPPNDPPPGKATPSKVAGTYQLRCWQYGRLLFDEGPVTLGAEARQGAKLVAIDRNGAPLIVTDAGGTTCLARPSAAPPSLALPR